MPDISTVLSVAALSGLVGSMLWLAERISAPYPALLAVVGIAIGALANLPFNYQLQGIVGDIVDYLANVQFSAGSLYLFLVALLFNAALKVDLRQIGEEVASVLFLAVTGVIVCTFVVGSVLWPTSPVGLLGCLILGTIIATTDPAAVVSMFLDIGAPRRLSTLVQGESVFSDVAAIAFYSLFVAVLAGDRPSNALDGILAFLRQFSGGLVTGYVVGSVVTVLMPNLRASHFVEATLTIALAYVIFIVCDHYLSFSGVAGVASAALAVSAEGRRRLSLSNWESLITTWGQLAFWASSLIFLFAATHIPALLAGATWGDLALLGALIVISLVARVLTLYGLIPVLSFVRIAKPIKANYRLAMLCGGVPGAVSLALALIALENTALPPEFRQFIGVIATGFVLFTLLVTATTMRPLMRLLKIGRVPPEGVALRRQMLGLSLSSIPQEIKRVGRQHRISADIVAEVARAYAEDANGFTEIAVKDAQSPNEMRERAALSALADRELEFCLDYAENRAVSRRVAASLLAHASRLRDGAYTDGLLGYHQASVRILRFNLTLRLLFAIHYRFRIGRPLAQHLADRFEVQLATRFVLANITAFNRDQIVQVFGTGPSEVMAKELELRVQALDRAISAMRLQYPTYARQLELQFLARAAAQLEQERYWRLHAESLINLEIFRDLQHTLLPRRLAINVRPTLDLSIEREELVSRVPMFAALDVKALRPVARLLQARIAVPEELIVRKGERGDAMYFISSGAVEVRISPTPVKLGSGDFFGELALLIADRRNADVVALGYCQLFTLAAGDLRSLFGTEPALRDQIHAVAQARTAAVR